MHPYRGGPRKLPIVSWPLMQGCLHCDNSKIYLFEMCRKYECPDDERMHEHFMCERCGFEWLCVWNLPDIDTSLPNLPNFNFLLPHHTLDGRSDHDAEAGGPDEGATGRSGSSPEGEAGGKGADEPPDSDAAHRR